MSDTGNRFDIVLPLAEDYHASTMSDTRNPTPIRPGMKARFAGIDYTVAGRAVFGMVEEGVTYYWHEWQLVAADGAIAFLELDEGRWKLMRPFIPTTPIGPQQAGGLGAGASINLDGTGVRVTQNSNARVHFVEGEHTYNVIPGDRVNYIDAGYGNHLYGVEWSRDEIEFYRGRYITEREVLMAFGFSEELKALDRRATKRRSQMVFATVCLVVAFLSFVLWGRAMSGGRLVQKGTLPLASVDQNGVRYGPFTLDPSRRVHRLVISANMTESSAWVGGVLESADETELLDTQRDFWDESGYDDDGRWHESDLRTQRDFIIENPGPYYIRLYVERDNPTGNYQDVSYELRDGVIYPIYFAWLGFITLTLSILFFVLSSKEKLAQMAANAD